MEKPCQLSSIEHDASVNSFLVKLPQLMSADLPVILVHNIEF